MRLFAYKVIGINKAKIRSPELPRFSALCVPMDGGGAEGFPIAVPSRWLALCFAIYILEGEAVVERIFSNACHAIWDGDRHKPAASPERPISNTRHAMWDDYSGNIPALVK